MTDSVGLQTALETLTAGQRDVRPGWASIIWCLQQDPMGGPPAPWGRLDLRVAPSFPAPGSGVWWDLRAAALLVISRAPVIRHGDIGPLGLLVDDVPELTALAILDGALMSLVDHATRARWAGLATGLLCVPVEPEDEALRLRLLVACAGRAGAFLVRRATRVIARLSQDCAEPARYALSLALDPVGSGRRVPRSTRTCPAPASST